MSQDGETMDFTVPPHPKGTTLEGRLVRLVPREADRHAEDLFAANALDEEGANWTWLPYGPFGEVGGYADWVRGLEGGDDPVFFAITRRDDGKAVGVASYLRIKPADGSIEVGHINYSPLLQRTTEATEAMFLMMQWAFESGYRRYEWKCNARNLGSRRAAQRLGLSYEGVFRQATMSKGRNRDTAWFAAIDKEWDALRACFGEFLAEGNFGPDGAPKVSLSSLTRPHLYKLDDLAFSGEGGSG